MERMLNAKGTLERNTGNLASIEVGRSWVNSLRNSPIAKSVKRANSYL